MSHWPVDTASLYRLPECTGDEVLTLARRVGLWAWPRPTLDQSDPGKRGERALRASEGESHQ